MKKIRHKTLKFASLLLLLFLSTGIIVGAWYVKTVEQVVAVKFEGQKWQFPSKIYSDTSLLYVGMNLRTEELAEKLRRLGYHEVRQSPQARGEYRFLKRDGLLEIYLQDFAYPLEKFKGFPIQIALQRGTIAKMANRNTGEEHFSLELEPELITGLYNRIWEERRLVKLSDVPPLLVHAVLSIEDERFYRHRGIDPVAILRASWVNLRSGAVVQGGSTLTQQLMKNFFLDEGRTLQRKFKEALMALIAERKYSKEEILENYLNEIYLGQKGAQGIFGVWEASQFYFLKEPKELTVGEMALLAGLIRAPGRYSPYRSIELATQRRNVVLGKMLQEKILTRGQYEAAVREAIQRRELIKVANDAPFYVDFLRRELAENYSNEVLTAEGLKIFTSLDLHLQRLAERALADGLKRLEETYPYLRKRGEEDHLEGAIIVVKPQTGEIKAMVGGRDYQKSQFNRVFQARRQPGSTVKPFTYLGAFMYGSEEGGKKFTSATLVDDSPFTWSYEGQEWTPRNYKEEYFGTVTVRTALEKSLNSATVRIAREVGINKIRDLAYRLGIESSLPALPSLVLGGVEVTPLELATAFSTLANNGVRTHPLAVKQVMDQEGRALEKRDIRVERVISPQMAFMINHLLKGVLDRGTGYGARAQGFDRAAAGKTGTTNDLKDAWFAGYTPDLLAVVWVGFDNQTKLGLSGAQAALPIWTDFMKRATAGTPVTDFVPPPGIKMVNIDPLSGYLATSNCPRVILEAFIEGEEPSGYCPLHPAPFARLLREPIDLLSWILSPFLGK
ncbi:MAG TPA: PBP1A family penicillin-binding protein [Candidatus Binatia bacterium]|nr:PBP1A family penicillin-binding protein [Candidatus Binatia bacterium]